MTKHIILWWHHRHASHAHSHAHLWELHGIKLGTNLWESTHHLSLNTSLTELLEILLRHHLHILGVYQLAKVEELIQIFFFTKHLEILVWTHVRLTGRRRTILQFTVLRFEV